MPLYHSIILAELVRVLGSDRIQKRFHPTADDIEIAVELMVRNGELITPTTRFVLCRDPNDNIFLDIAFAGQAEMIVSGDEELLALHPFGNIPIVKPSEFLLRIAQA